MKVVAIVQARMGSARLPGKSLAVIAGRPMVVHVIERALAIPGVDEVVLATTDQERDRPLAELAYEMGAKAFCGDEHNVLGRFAQIASQRGADIVMRLTGDCPLLAPEVCWMVLDRYKMERAEVFVSNDTTCSGYPDGTDCEVFSARTLYRADVEADDHPAWVHGDREHVTSWMRRNLQTVVVSPPDGSDYRTLRLKLSVDSASDLERVRRLHGNIARGDYSLAATLAAEAWLAGRA